ncbi:MAG: tRNA cyclic N6-threonylcarbamoyladenosine(37) synthase TcdA [Gammaproteobacteria bacterium]|nr:tRNA cyclic N6-threonylcarbamoyladenosine(37) synthase TcdA [Gammaproteobacteria bacterium]
MNDIDNRFSALTRVYGQDMTERFRRLRVCVVGIGGVGSWAAESLARCGIGSLVLIDNDDIAETNINRQIHALGSTLGQPKVEVMAQRIRDINPACDCRPVDDLLVTNNLAAHLDGGFDYVIDAIDNVRFKADLIYYCKRNAIPVVTTGGAGGAVDPTAVQVADLSKTWNDPLAAKVRSRLRSEYGWTKNPRRRFGVDCVFSTEQPLYPQADGAIGHRKPGVKGVSLDCDRGYGSAVFVTATFGMIAASCVINRSVRKWRRQQS